MPLSDSLNAANNLKLVLAKNCVLIDAIAILSAGNVTSPSVLQQKQWILYVMSTMNL